MRRALPPATEPAQRPRPAAEIRRRRRRLFALLVFTSLLVGQEVAFRAMFPLPDAVGFNRVRYQLLARHDSRAWPIYQRGLVYERLLFESELDGFREVHRLNRYGFRGDDFAVERPRGRRRALFVGDSVTEGEGTPEGGTIPAVFARLLRADGDAAEIINLGVVAASLRETTRLARDAIALLKPTDVVIVLYANDLPAPPYPGDLDEPAPGFPRRQEMPWAPWCVQLVGRVAERQPIYRRWPHSRTPFFLPTPDPTNPWTGVRSAPPGLDPAAYRAMAGGRLNPWLWQQARTIPRMLAHDFDVDGGSPEPYLKRVIAACAAVDARLVVAFVPFCGVTHPRYAPAQIALGMDRATATALANDPVYHGQNLRLAALCRRLRVPFADATAALEAAEASGRPQYWSFDTHPRPAGYATIARCVHQTWRQVSRAAGKK